MSDLEILLPDICKSILSKLGGFHREHVYQRALTVELQERNFFVEEEVNIPITYPLHGKSITLAIERADIIVNQSCIIEIKVGSPKPQTIVSAMGQVNRYMTYYRSDAAKMGYVLIVAQFGIHLYKVQMSFDGTPQTIGTPVFCTPSGFQKTHSTDTES